MEGVLLICVIAATERLDLEATEEEGVWMGHCESVCDDEGDGRYEEQEGHAGGGRGGGIGRPHRSKDVSKSKGY